jgi:hypothetical protein
VVATNLSSEEALVTPIDARYRSLIVEKRCGLRLAGNTPVVIIQQAPENLIWGTAI